MASWVQIDGSDHRWFERRGEPCTLLVFIDDATSRLMQLRFVPSEHGRVHTPERAIGHFYPGRVRHFYPALMGSLYIRYVIKYK
jgi:hypothetical protein